MCLNGAPAAVGIPLVVRIACSPCSFREVIGRLLASAAYFVLKAVPTTFVPCDPGTAYWPLISFAVAGEGLDQLFGGEETPTLHHHLHFDQVFHRLVGPATDKSDIGKLAGFDRAEVTG